MDYVDYVVVEFSDLTVSSVPTKWETKVGKIKKCYFPKTGASAKIKAAVDVDKKSGKWHLYSYRRLMKGATFATYALARKAELIAQNHSTMSSFEKSYALNQKLRKKPVVLFDTSSSSSSCESECQDFKNIKKLSKLDKGMKDDVDKVYNYSNHPDNANCSQSEQPLNNDGGWLVANDDNDSPFGNDVNVNSNDDCNSSNNHNESFAEDVNGNNNNNEYSSGEERDDEKNYSITESYSNENGNKNLSRIDLCNPSHFPFESTNQPQDINSGYNNFSVERRLLFIEKAVFEASEQSKETQSLLKEAIESLNEMKVSIHNLTLTMKDLAVEVFDGKEELKKRNGLFTDLLVPDIQLPIKSVGRYGDVELALHKHKIVDNMIKYLATTVNESKQNNFIKTCLDIIFTKKFFMKKVWWKKEKGKVCIKNSQILHCIRESFKMKFGLEEPRKTDKDIVNLIHKICKNVKDTTRKATKAEKIKLACEENEKNEAFEMAYQLQKSNRAVEEDKQVSNILDDKDERNIKKAEKAAKHAAKLGKAKQASDEAEQAKSVQDDKNERDKKEAKQAAKAAAKLEDAKQADEEKKRAKKAAKKTVKNSAKLEMTEPLVEEDERNGVGEKANENFIARKIVKKLHAKRKSEEKELYGTDKKPRIEGVNKVHAKRTAEEKELYVTDKKPRIKGVKKVRARRTAEEKELCGIE